MVGFVYLTGPVLFNSSFAFADNLNTNVNIKPSLTLTIPESSIDLVLDPASKAFDSQDLHISIGTNNSTGYKLTMSADSTSLININDNTNTIPTIESASDYDEDSFPVNKWGYKISASSSNSNNSNYLPFVSGTTILENNSKTNYDAATLTFASKIDYTKPAGLYNTILNFKTIPNVTQYYMQDLSNPTLAQEVCTTDRPSIVIDKRDEQAYTIQRLPDGKCWMLDNLNLDLTNASIVAGLSPENTNADTASLKSLRQGNRTDCGEADCSRYAMSGLSLENWEGGSSYTVPMVNKSGYCDPSYNNGDCATQYQGLPYNNNKIIDVYNIGVGGYKLGIYYNYCAASAGNYCYYHNEITVADRAVYDICPSDWRLPTGGPSGEFQKLYNELQKKYPDSVNNAADQSSFAAKLSLTFAGLYHYRSAFGLGKYALYWSSTMYNISAIYRTFISFSSADLQNSRTRDRAQPVRCLLNES